VGFHRGGASDANFFKVIRTTSRWVGWTKFGQEILPKPKCTLPDRLKKFLPPLLEGTTTSEETVDSPGGVHCSLNGHEAA
jgi:hypothetical protein